jgi:hypothetical protein
VGLTLKREFGDIVPIIVPVFDGVGTMSPGVKQWLNDTFPGAMDGFGNAPSGPGLIEARAVYSKWWYYCGDKGLDVPLKGTAVDALTSGRSSLANKPTNTVSKTSRQALTRGELPSDATEKSILNFSMAVVVNRQNRGKENSLQWFFNGICSGLGDRNSFAFLADCGTTYSPTHLARLFYELRLKTDPLGDHAVVQDEARSMYFYPYESTPYALTTKTEAAGRDSGVLSYVYPPSTPGSVPNNGKYWHELSPTSREALTTVERWVAKEKFDLAKISTADLHPALLLLRYLRANQFNATKAIAHLQRNAEWRATKDIDELNKQTPEEILGCKIEELTAVFPHWHSGYDKTGRPVLFKQYGKFDAAKVKKLVGGSFEPVVRYHLWEQEACGRLCLAQSRKLKVVVETITGVIDIKDMGMSQITSDFLSLTKLLAEVDQNQYPETLGRAFIINAPSAFPIVWRMVKPWLDPATVAKITVLGGPKEYIPVLQEFIGEENLPSNYGGTLPPLSPQVHPYAETMLSYPTAKPSAEAEPEEKQAEPPLPDANVVKWRYPETTPGAAANNGKYWHELSTASHEALTIVEQWVAKEKFDLAKISTADVHPALLLLRYLRANQFNATKTIAHLQRNAEWRKSRDIEQLITLDPEAVLGCKMEELTAVFPHWHSGYDKTGRPVLFKQYGKFDAGQVKKLTGGNYDNVVRYHLWEQEACGRLCLAQSLKTETIVETITGVIDIKDMGMSQITSDFMKLTKALAEIDQNQYPETLGRAFIINAPSAFPIVWRMVKPWLDPATVAKITVLGGPKEYIPVLQEFIGEENLPSNYGGTLPPLSPQVHPYAETMQCLPTLAAQSAKAVPTVAEEAQFDPEVLTYMYPTSTPGSIADNSKYWQQLSPQSQEALTAVEQWVAREKFEVRKISTAELHPALLLLRYLRANQFNAAKTITHLQKNAEWRKTKDIDALIKQTPEEILGCKMEELTAVFPHWHSGYDKTGRPVLFKQYGKFDAAKVKKLVGGSFEPVVRYHLWEQEACGRLCLAQSRKLRMIVETITGVIDIKDMGMSQITRDFLSLTKLLAEVDQNQYPETLGRCFIINAPAAFPLVWRMVKPWLDPATVAKITVLGGPKEYIPVLQEFIGEENLPSNYGGTLPPLSPQVHPYAETMLTYGSTDTGPLSNQDVRAAYAAQAGDRSSFRNSFRLSQRRRSLNGRPADAPGDQDSSLWYYPSLLWTGLQKNWFNSSPADDTESAWEGGSHGSDSSEELYFQDAFETESDLETNSHSHLYSAKPAEGTSSTPVPGKRRRPHSWLRRFFLYRALRKCFRVAVFDKPLRALTIQRLENRFLLGGAIHLFCAVGCAAISATALAEIQWSSSGTRLQLWAYTVVLLMSCFMILFDFVGYYGLQAKNWPLMVMYSSGTTVGTLVFLAVTIAGFLYYSLPSSTGTGNASLNSTLSENREFMISLSVGCLFMTLCAMVPLILARGVIIKLRQLQGKHLQTRQIQSVLKFAQSISTVAAVVMLSYGGFSVGYLLKINYNPALFSCYGLIYGGVSVLITSSIGVWVANTVHRSVLRLYQNFVLPFIVALLLCVALVSFSSLSNTEQDVHDAYPDLDTTNSEEKVKATVQTILLVTGTFTVFLCVFQAISLTATRALSGTIDSSGQVKEKMAILQAIKEKELGIFTSAGIVGGSEAVNRDSYWAEFSVEDLGRLYMLYSRNQRDRFAIAWAVFSGLFNIFVCGTLAVLSRSASTSGSDNSWMFSLLHLLGTADTRFIISNAYLRSSESVLAVIVGPLLLIYAWCTFVYAPYRYNHLTAFV